MRYLKMKLTHPLAALVAIALLLLPGCAHNTIQPIDGVTIDFEGDIDRVQGGVDIEPPKVFCEGEQKLPFPTGKLGALCDAIRGGEGDGASGEGVSEGDVPEAVGEAEPVSDAGKVMNDTVAYRPVVPFLNVDVRQGLRSLRPEFTGTGLAYPRFSPAELRPGPGIGAALHFRFS